MKTNQIFATLVVLFLVFRTGGGRIPECDTVVEDLSPCIDYADRNSPAPSSDCCAGVRSLAQYGGNQADRTAICECLKSVASMFPPLDPKLIQLLPSKCGTNVVLPPISYDMNCTNV